MSDALAASAELPVESATLVARIARRAEDPVAETAVLTALLEATAEQGSGADSRARKHMYICLRRRLVSTMASRPTPARGRPVPSPGTA